MNNNVSDCKMLARPTITCLNFGDVDDEILGRWRQEFTVVTETQGSDRPVQSDE